MKKLLTISKEQARLLYNLLSAYQEPNRSDNRKRFKFLKVIEEFVDGFDDETRKISSSEDKRPQVEKTAAITELGKKTQEFTFNDREVFTKAKDMFEKCYAVGNLSRNGMGKVDRSPLIGRDAKMYVELEDAFADVKDIKEDKKA